MLELRRSPSWVRAVLALYLLGSLFLVAFHQHHDAALAYDCALCALAHTPAVVATATLESATAVPVEKAPVPPNDRGWDSEFGHAPRSRAPPA